MAYGNKKVIMQAAGILFWSGLAIAALTGDLFR
jgi:hypothetical protein